MDTHSFFEEKHDVVAVSLHDAAARGDEEAVRRLVASGASLDALDGAGRTVVVRLILGESPDANSGDVFDASPMTRGRVNTLRFLLARRRFSLYTLNAPQEALHGVTPLGMAAYLNQVEVVSVLLNDSYGFVSVDAVDSHGATPLMYAARDGNADVVKCLLDHGANPQIKDANYRSSMQFALNHPRTLWLCERALRTERTKALQSGKSRTKHRLSFPPNAAPFTHSSGLDHAPPLIAFSSTSTTESVQTLIDAITSSNLTVIQSMLFPPLSSSSSSSRIAESSVTTNVLLVNRPDAKGWSPIHYCTTAPEPDIMVLDTLFLAGADVGLFTTIDHSTPLHCLARAARESNEDSAFLLYSFIVHLVRDLRAPLAAQDHRGETCIHVAAEHGQSIAVLMAFLDCDASSTVAEMHNSRGLTASEIARPEFRVAFGSEQDMVRPASCASVRTIKPSTSISSLSSFTDDNLFLHHSRRTPASPFQPKLTLPQLTNDVFTSSEQVLDGLRTVASGLRGPQRADLDHLQHVLHESAAVGGAVMQRLHTRIEEARSDLADCQRVYTKVDALTTRLEEGARKRPGAGTETASRTVWTSTAAASSSSSLASVTLVGSPDGSQYSPRASSFRAPESPRSRTRSSPTPPRPKAPKAPTHPHLSESLPVNMVAAQKKHLWPTWLNPFLLKTNSEYNAHLAHLVDVEKVLFGSGALPASAEPAKERSSSALRSLKNSCKRPFSKIRRKGDTDLDKTGLDLFVRCTEDGVAGDLGNAAEFALRKVTSEPPAQPMKMGTPQKQVRGRTKSAGSSQALSEAVRDVTRNSRDNSLYVLDAVRRDMFCIDEAMTCIEPSIALGYRSVTQAERLTSKILKAKEHNIQSSRLYQALDDLSMECQMYQDRSTTPELFASAASSPDERVSISSAFPSAHASTTSLTSLLPDDDDEDTRALKRLLLRKIPARIDGVFDEVEKVTQWLGVVRETIRTVQKQNEHV